MAGGTTGPAASRTVGQVSLSNARVFVDGGPACLSIKVSLKQECKLKLGKS